MWFNPYSPLQGFYQVFMKDLRFCFFFKSLKDLRNLKHGQFDLNYIVHLENNDQFLSKAQIANSDQDKIRFESYCPFKVSI